MNKTLELAKKLKELMSGKTIATAESCTGGMLACYITDVAGSSDYFVGGLVTYSNALKMKLLGVEQQTLRKNGAVSMEVANEMAKGCLRITESNIAVAITGIAGPKGGKTEKPVGTVFIAVGKKDKIEVKKFLFSGERRDIREQSCYCALEMVIGFLS